MSALEALLFYTGAGVIGYIAGWLAGRESATTEADRMRKWWFDREQKQRSERS